MPENENNQNSEEIITTGQVSQFKLGDYVYKYRDTQALIDLDSKADIVTAQGGSIIREVDFDPVSAKVDGIEAGAQVNPPIDNALSATSENAVQNKVIKTKFDNIENLLSTRTAFASSETAGIVKVGANLSIDPTTGTLSSFSTYTLPTASNNVLGGIKLGNTLSINNDGVANINLPTATAVTLGGVKIGYGISIEDGFISPEINLSDLTNTTIDNPVNGQILKYNGTGWENSSLPIATSNIVGGIKIGNDLSISNGTVNLNKYENVEFTIEIELESGSYITSTDKYKLLENIINKQDDTYDYSSCLFIPKTLYLDSIKDDSDNDLNIEDWICNLKECYEKVISDETKLNVNINLYNFNFSGSENIATLKFKVSGTCIGTRETIPESEP